MVSKSQLAQRIAARGASPAQAQHAVDAVLGEITAALAAGEKVTLVGFGSFEPVARPARTARNPRTGAAVPVPAATVARFHAGAGLKAALGGAVPVLGEVGSLSAPATGRAAVPPATAPAKAGKPAKPAKDEAKAKKDAKPKARKGTDAKGKKSGKKRKG